MVTLEQAKMYLRIESTEEDALILSFLETARELCEGILRASFEDFETIPKAIDHAILFITANLYEHREDLDLKVVEDVVRRLLFPHRLESW